MYPFPSDIDKKDPTPHGGQTALPEQRPPVDSAMLNEPTSEVPIIRPISHPPTFAVVDPPRPDPIDVTEAIDLTAASESDGPDHQPDRMDEDDPAGEAPAASGAETFEVTTDATAEAESAVADDQADAPEADSEADAEDDTEDDTDTMLDDDVTDAAVDDEPKTANPAAITDPTDVAEAAGDPPQTPVGTTMTDPAPEPAPQHPGDLAERPVAVWSEAAAAELRERWRDLQGQFIDDPAEAVAGAKALVTEAVQTLAETLLTAQRELDPYQPDAEVDTETMRVAMRRYREFLDRVLAL